MKKSIVVLSLTVGLLLPVSVFAQQNGGGGHDTTATADAVAVGTAINAPTTTTTTIMTTTVDPTIQAGAGVEISDDSVTNTKVSNTGYRQIPMGGIPGLPDALQNFSPLKYGNVPAWNDLPPLPNCVWVPTGKKSKTPYAHIWKSEIYNSYPRTSAVRVVGSGEGHGEILREIIVVLNPDQASPDARRIGQNEAMDLGGNLVEMVLVSSIQRPKSEQKSIGFGGGGGGVIGGGEKAVLNATGGTNMGSVTLEVESKMYAQMRIYRNGEPQATSSVVSTPTTSKVDESDSKIEQKWKAMH